MMMSSRLLLSLLLSSSMTIIWWIITIRNVRSMTTDSNETMANYLGSLGQKIYYQGERYPDERQVLNRTIKAYNKHFQYVTEEIDYPGWRRWGYNISYIEAIDRIFSDANISVIEGGVNCRRAKIRIVSALSGRISFDVNVFTREPLFKPTQEPQVIPWLDKIIEEAISQRDVAMAQSTTIRRPYY